MRARPQPLSPALGLLVLLSGCATQLPGLFQFETFDDRSTGSAIPAAPPPPAFRGRVDIQARELGATIAPALEAGAHGATGLAPLRTDGAIGITVTDFFAFRLLGGAAYGTPATIGAPSVPFSQRPPLVGGIGAVFGWWGDRNWSISFELDLQLALLAGLDRYQVVIGHCFQGFAVLGGDDIQCGTGNPTGALHGYEGYFGTPTLGTTVDAAGYPLPWLRLGVSASMQGLVTRGTAGTSAWRPVGLARVFVEAHVDDVWLGVEVQQGLAAETTFYPAVAATIGGSLGPRTRADHHPTSPSPPGAWHAIVSERK